MSARKKLAGFAVMGTDGKEIKFSKEGQGVIDLAKEEEEIKNGKCIVVKLEGSYKQNNREKKNESELGEK